jgi:hypothetical protein
MKRFLVWWTATKKETAFEKRLPPWRRHRFNMVEQRRSYEEGA